MNIIPIDLGKLERVYKKGCRFSMEDENKGCVHVHAFYITLPMHVINQYSIKQHKKGPEVL